MRIDDKIAIIRDAIKTGKQVLCTFDGTTSQGPQSLPNWRYFDLAELTDVIAVEGEWRRGETTGSRQQHGVEVVVEVAPPEREALRTRIAKPRTPSRGPRRQSLKKRW